jgi:hypothetical protein
VTTCAPGRIPVAHRADRCRSLYPIVAAVHRLGHLLTNHLQPRAVLALTATAPPATRASILQLLHIPPEHQVVESPLRSNLRLRVVRVPPGSAKEGRVGTLIVGLFKSGMTGAVYLCVHLGMPAHTGGIFALLLSMSASQGCKGQQRMLHRKRASSPALQHGT